jgi:glucose-1-phosphate cytidylyltransferase
MKTIILCGGMGTRMKEETEFKPKPMVLIGGKPILWHIMKLYSHYGYNDFVLALGYKGDMIKDYFLDQRAFVNDFTIEVSSGKTDFHNNGSDDFKVTLAETGQETETGGRIIQLKKYVTEDEFMITFGDGVSDINIKDLVAFHRNQKTIGTIGGFHPQSKYGLVKIDEGSKKVINFEQKPVLFDYTSGGFMIFNREAFNYFDEGTMESGLIKMVNDGQLSMYRHEGFWKCMDTYREMEELNKLWEKNKPWAVWENKKNNEEK